MKKILALDFDGVICNSITECMHISYKAYIQATQSASMRTDTIPTRMQQDFLNYRYLIGPAKKFYYLWKAIIECEKQSGRIDYYYFKLKNENQGSETEFEKLFYSVRDEMKSNNYDQWISLNPIYDEMRHALNNSIDIDKLLIVTAKDSVSIVDILRANQIIVDKSNVFGREISLNKVELFIQIIRERNIQPENIYYLEDKISILVDLKETGITGFLATWGYNSPEAVSLAEQEVIQTLSLSELDSLCSQIYNNTG